MLSEKGISNNNSNNNIHYNKKNRGIGHDTRHESEVSLTRLAITL